MTDRKRVLVTGGAGFIGSHTVVELHEAGFAPVIVDDFRNSERHVLDRLEQLLGTRVPCYEADCSDPAALATVFASEPKIWGAIHFAALKAVGESVEQPLAYYRNNLDSLLCLLDLMGEHEVRPLVFSSSCTVYGTPDALPVTEASPVKPAESPYGATKQICEQILLDAVAAEMPLQAMLLRYFNPIGAHPSGLIGELPIGMPNNLVPFVTQTAAGIREKLTVFGDDYGTPDGTCIRDYIHVVDLARAHVASLTWLGKQPEASLAQTLNLGTGRGSSVLEIVEAFERSTGVPVPREIGPRRSGDVEAIYADVCKSEQVLGWQAELSLDQAMEDAWRWQRSLGASAS